jgi:hypothetical protein
MVSYVNLDSDELMFTLVYIVPLGILCQQHSTGLKIGRSQTLSDPFIKLFDVWKKTLDILSDLL